jgi:hypothetical protein
MMRLRRQPLAYMAYVGQKNKNILMWIRSARKMMRPRPIEIIYLSIENLLNITADIHDMGHFGLIVAPQVHNLYNISLRVESRYGVPM